MLQSFVRSTALFIFIAGEVVHAFNGISIASTVVANTTTNVTISNDLGSPHSFDSEYDSYRLYLSITPPGWAEGPTCYLVNSSAIAVTTQSVEIPASIGENGEHYAIVAMEFNQDPDALGPSQFEYSGEFTLTNGTGQWSQYELYGAEIGNPNYLPCSAYNCARTCAQKFYPDNTDTTNATAYETTYNCIANCTGTSFPSWAAMVNATETATSTTTFQFFTTTTTRSTSSKSSATSTTSTRTSTTSTLTTTSSASTPTKTSGGGNVGASYGLLVAGVLGVMAL